MPQAATDGGVDTVRAIVGSITAARLGATAIPAEWHERCEPLPRWAEVGQRA